MGYGEGDDENVLELDRAGGDTREDVVNTAGLCTSTWLDLCSINFTSNK